jgi:sugar lactone lactonase YvrE
MTRYVTIGCCILFAACHKDHVQTTPPSGLYYTPDSAIVLPGTSDTSVTPIIVWNGGKGILSFAGTVPQGITIDGGSGKITWPSTLPIGNYVLPVSAGNGAAEADTVFYTLIVSGKIMTIAGFGTTGGFSGDGGDALDAQFYLPFDVTFDAHGNLYVADGYNSRIRMIAPNGVISTVAGNGTNSFSGDGGPALQASLSDPSGVVADATGNLYITDYGYNRIRKVDAAGIITTVAGSSNTNAANFGDGGSATQASLYNLAGKIALDGQGSIYIPDYGHQLVRQVTPDGIIHTITGNGNWGMAIPDGTAALKASIPGPSGVYWSGTSGTGGSLYIASDLGSAIYRLSAGNIYGVAGQGAPVGQFAEPSGAFNRPTNIVADAQGNLFVADFQNNRVRRIDPSGNIITIAGNGTQGFSGDGGPAAAAQLSLPFGLAIDAAGNLYIADTYNNRIRKVILH